MEFENFNFSAGFHVSVHQTDLRRNTIPGGLVPIVPIVPRPPPRYFRTRIPLNPFIYRSPEKPTVPICTLQKQPREKKDYSKKEKNKKERMPQKKRKSVRQKTHTRLSGISSLSQRPWLVLPCAPLTIPAISSEKTAT